jgi:signal transduction histidine kinase
MTEADSEELDRLRECMRERASQQAAVARLGSRAVSGLRADMLLAEAVTTVRETLHADLCEIFELVDDEAFLVLRAGDGWPVDAVDRAGVTIGDRERLGVLLAADPVVVEDVGCDDRFARSPALSTHGVTSWISVVVAGSGRPYGVLGAHTMAPRVFTADDVAFVQVVATLLAGSMERRNADAERERLLAATKRADAEEALRVRADFLGLMTHELRTPLNAIGGYAELLERGLRGPVTEEQRTDLGRIRRSQRYLIGVIDNVLSYLKLGSGRVRYDVADVDVTDIMATVEELTRPLIDRKGLRYECRCIPRRHTVRADRDKLQQIVLNLMSNAVKFTDSGGAVVVTCDHHGDDLFIRVADTGWGIPGERLEYVFEPFAQVDGAPSRVAGGTGLGLTISRDFARGMGGDLTVSSEPGKGSVFTVALRWSENADLPVAAATRAM